MRATPDESFAEKNVVNRSRCSLALKVDRRTSGIMDVFRQLLVTAPGSSHRRIREIARVVVLGETLELFRSSYFVLFPLFCFLLSSREVGIDVEWCVYVGVGVGAGGTKGRLGGLGRGMREPE